MLVSVLQFQYFFLALTRVMAMIIHVPFLGGPIIPNQLRIGLGVILTLLVLPWTTLQPAEAEALELFPYAIAIGEQILIGTLAGFAASIIFGMLEVAGEIMSTGSGFAAGRIMNPSLEMAGSPLNQLFYMFAIAIFLVINGHHQFLAGIQQTFIVLPLFEPVPTLGAERVVELSATLLTVGVQLSLPITAALLLTDLALGLLARVAPQLHVFFLGMPLKVGLGILLLGWTFTALMPNLLNLFHLLPEWMLGLLGA